MQLKGRSFRVVVDRNSGCLGVFWGARAMIKFMRQLCETYGCPVSFTLDGGLTLR